MLNSIVRKAHLVYASYSLRKTDIFLPKMNIVTRKISLSVPIDLLFW